MCRLRHLSHFFVGVSDQRLFRNAHCFDIGPQSHTSSLTGCDGGGDAAVQQHFVGHSRGFGECHGRHRGLPHGMSLQAALLKDQVLCPADPRQPAYHTTRAGVEKGRRRQSRRSAHRRSVTVLRNDTCSKLFKSAPGWCAIRQPGSTIEATTSSSCCRNRGSHMVEAGAGLHVGSEA